MAFLLVMMPSSCHSFTIPVVVTTNHCGQRWLGRHEARRQQQQHRRRQPPISLLSLPLSLSSSTTTQPTSQSVEENDNDFTTPLPFHTFAGQVEQTLKDQFGEAEIQRVLQCWRRLEADCEYNAGVHDLLLLSSSDEKHDMIIMDDEDLRYQQCHSYVPGLTVREFWDISTLPWATTLQNEFASVIRQEFQQQVTQQARNHQELQKRGNNVWSSALTEEAVANYGQGWKTLVLMDRGVWDTTNIQFFPETVKAILQANVPAVEVFFASMEPNSSIPTHSDNTNFVLTCHLGLEIPTPPMDDGKKSSVGCQLRVGNQIRKWQNETVMVFDTSLQHNAINDTPQTRYILMMRFWHPDLTITERQALQFIWDCLERPELALSSTPWSQKQELWQQQQEQRRTLPTTTLWQPSKKKDDTPTKPVQGFGGAGGFQTNNKKKKDRKKGRSKK